MSESSATLQKTPFHALHLAAGAKMVPFAGFEMPIQYPSGITAEHNTVRTSCGVFDVSHMGEFLVRGPQAIDFVNFVTSNDVAALAIGQVHYSAILTEQGTFVDDCLVYRYSDHLMMVVNGSNKDKDFAHISKYLSKFDCEAHRRQRRYRTPRRAGGPKAQEILQKLTPYKLDEIKYYWFTETTVGGIPMTLSRTGYTGEDGFELYHDAKHSGSPLGRSNEDGDHHSRRPWLPRLAPPRDGDGALRQRHRRHRHPPRSGLRLARQDEEG